MQGSWGGWSGPIASQWQAAVERALAFNLEWFASPLYEGREGKDFQLEKAGPQKLPLQKDLEEGLTNGFGTFCENDTTTLLEYP